MSYRKPLIGLSLFLVISAVLTWMVFATLNRGIGGSTKEYSALFTDATGLKAGDDVRMAGVRVGRVDSVELSGVLADVSFKVEADQPVYGNTKASIVYQNIIGQRYLGLSLAEFGDPSTLSDGDQIPVERTEPSFDVTALLNGFEPLFSTLDPDEVDNVTNAIIVALQGDSGSITSLIAQTSALAESVAGRDEVLGAVITNLNGVVGNLAAQSGNVRTVIDQTSALLSTLASKKDSLTTSLDGIAAVTSQIAAVVSDVQPDLRELLTREPGFASHVVQNQDRFAYLGANLPLLLKGLARIMQDGTYMNMYFCDAYVSLLPVLHPLFPTIVALATPGGSPKYSAICR